MSVVDFTELQRISQKRSKAAVRKYLDKLKILYRLGGDGAPWTTTEALNRVLLGQNKSAEPNLQACHRSSSNGRPASIRSMGGTTSSIRTGGTHSPVLTRAPFRSGVPTTASPEQTPSSWPGSFSRSSRKDSPK